MVNTHTSVTILLSINSINKLSSFPIRLSGIKRSRLLLLLALFSEIPGPHTLAGLVLVDTSVVSLALESVEFSVATRIRIMKRKRKTAIAISIARSIE